MVQPDQTILSKDVNLFGQVIFSFHLSGDPLEHWWSDRPVIIHGGSSSGTLTVMDLESNTFQSRALTSDWADVEGCMAVVVLGSYLYALLIDADTSPDTYRVYRYDRTNLAAGGTLMTFSGGTGLTTTNSSLRMSSDGTYLYINFQAGNSANDYALAKYSISGTTLTYVSTTTCGSTSGRFSKFHVRATNGDIIAHTSQVLRRYDSSGVLQATSPTYNYVNNVEGLIYMNDYFLYMWFSNGVTPVMKGIVRVTIP